MAGKRLFEVMKRKKKNKNAQRQPIWKCVSAVLRLFTRKPRIINLAGELPTKAIYVANHSAMMGPVIYNLYLPAKAAPWGAYPMLGKYKSRYRYLRDVYFIQKRHKSKFAATILAAFEAFFSIFFYRGMRVVPTYNDVRFIRTIRQSMQLLKDDVSILIFPEDSTTGYREVLTGFFAGFVELARYYRHIYGEELPIVPVYYHSKKNTIAIGKPSVLSDYAGKCNSRREVAQQFCQQVNDLFEQHIEPLTKPRRKRKNRDN